MLKKGSNGSAGQDAFGMLVPSQPVPDAAGALLDESLPQVAAAGRRARGRQRSGACEPDVAQAMGLPDLMACLCSRSTRSFGMKGVSAGALTTQPMSGR